MISHFRTSLRTIIYCALFPPASAYTEAYRVCLLAAAPQAASGDVAGETTGEEDAGRTSEEEEGGADRNYDGQVRKSTSSCLSVAAKCCLSAFNATRP